MKDTVLKSLLLFALFTGTFFYAKAQEPSINDLIYIETLESKLIRYGYHARHMIILNPQAYELYRSAERDSYAAYTLGGVSCAGILASVFCIISATTANSMGDDFFKQDVSGYRTGAIVSGVIGLAALPFAISFGKRSRNKYDDAIMIYNNDILRQIEAYKKQRSIMNFGPTSSGGIGLELVF